MDAYTLTELRERLNAAEAHLQAAPDGSAEEAAWCTQANKLRAEIVAATMTAPVTTYRIEYTVERNGRATRKAIEGPNLAKLMARVAKLDAYQIITSSSTETR